MFLQPLLDSHVLNMGSGAHPITEHYGILGVIQSNTSIFVFSFRPCTCLVALLGVNSPARKGIL